MKQKRKVKSLISSTSENNLFLTGLLFLLGGILCFGAVSMFTSSVGVEAAGATSINYPGISDKHEVLLKFGLIPERENNPINEMYLKDNTFFMSGDNGIYVDVSNTNDSNKYINYLGGNGMNINSNNITIIGGTTDTVLRQNDNAAILGGDGTTIDEGNNGVAPVILGGKTSSSYKTIGKMQNGSAVVGGENNRILDNGSYDFILGGQNNQIKGNKVIVGGARVNVNDKSNLFAFSYTDFDPQLGNAFYLNFQNGLGLNEDATNKGVASKGAVSFGEIDIDSQACTTADAGVQGTWQGCLVGCTTLSASDGSNWQWEMIDHGTGCQKFCEDNSHCKISPLGNNVPTYKSSCTNIGVDTGNSTHCGGEEILQYYDNVLFETVVIDSDARCPDSIAENKCVFKCNDGYHLRKGEDDRYRCYQDCELVWDHSTITHNDTVVAYKATDAYCSNNAGTHENCSNYKATLKCDNGTLKVISSYANRDNGKEAYNEGYQYSGCMLHNYRCPATYNYSKTQIGSQFNDAAKNNSWPTNDRKTFEGNRGNWQLCIDYDTQGGAQYQNGESCNELNKNGNVYEQHYQWLGCKTHYHTGDRSNYVCMQDCTLKNPSGTTKYYLHNSVVTGYENNVVECTSAGNGKCKSAKLVCNDGKWYVNGSVTTAYQYNDCSLSDYECSYGIYGEYNVTEADKAAHEPASIYGSSCVSYKGESDRVTCSVSRIDYKLTNCLNWNKETGYHTQDNTYCISNKDNRNCTHAGAPVTNHFHYINALVPVKWSGTSYNNGSWSTPANCDWDCDSTFHLEDGDCISNTRHVNCSDYYNLPSNATWDRQGLQTWSNGSWGSIEYCTWSCNSGWHKVGNACEKDCTVVSCSAYTLDSCPEHGHCSSCTKVDASCNDGETTVQLDYCDDDYEPSSDRTSCDYNPSCDANSCSAYGLDECPEHGYCSYCTIKYTDCTTGDVKAQLNSCEDGYTKKGDTCEPINGGNPGGGDDNPPGGDDGEANSCSGCPSGTVEDGGKCTSYSGPTDCNNCDNKKRVSTCSDGDWDVEPYDYSSCSKVSCEGETYPCGGDAPSGDGVLAGDPGYKGSSYTPKDWTYVDTSEYSRKACTWTCDEGFHKDSDTGCAEGVRPYERYDCQATSYKYGSCTFSIPAISDGDSKDVTYETSPYYGSITAECDNGELSYSSKSCITVCSSSGNPAGCNGSFSATYPSTATWGSSYSYTCKYGTLSYSCSANCPSGTYWMGNDVYCSTAQTICGSTHNNCTNGGSYVSNSAGSTSTTYTWKCKRGDYTEPCTEAKQTCSNAQSQQPCEDPNDGAVYGEWNDYPTCSCSCPQNSRFTSNGCVCDQGYEPDGHQEECVKKECSNILEKQNCEVGQGGSAQGTWNDSTCSCDCPAGTIVTEDNHCAQEGGEIGGGTCDTYREFNPPWALYCPAPTGNYDSQCNSEAGAGWSCSFNDSCPGRVPMCECTRSEPCQGCSAAGACSSASHGDTCVTYTTSTTYGSNSCNTYKRTSKCENGYWSVTPGAYNNCTHVDESCEQGEIQVSYSETQYYQDVLNYSCSCQTSICCCSAPCDCGPGERRQWADSQTACQGISNCYPLQCSDDGYGSVDVCVW